MNYLKMLCSIFLLVVSFYYCSKDGTTAPTKPKEPTIDQNEYEVISAIIDSSFNLPDTLILAIRDETTLGFGSTDSAMLQYIIDNVSSINSQTIEDFKQKNLSSAKFHNFFNIKPQYILVTDTLTWEEFYDIHPNAYGIMSFSRVGLSADSNQAIVYWGHSFFWTLGAGYYYVVEKQDGKWKIIANFMAWIS